MEFETVDHLLLGEGEFFFVISRLADFLNVFGSFEQITKSGDPVCEFNVPLKKQPYEKIYLAAHIESERELQIDDINLLLSIPSVVHSHKPPLLGRYSINLNEIFRS